MKQRDITDMSTQKSQEEKIEKEVVINGRNFAFQNRQEEALDAVEEENGSIFIIPAQVGSTYWAILKVCYIHHDTPLNIEDIIEQAAEILEDRDPEKWNKFKNKKVIRTQKDGKPIKKEAQNWRKRLETNVKTLTRHGGNSPYGQRLRVRGHILRWEDEHFDGKGAYVLRTDTNQPIKRGRGRRKKR